MKKTLLLLGIIATFVAGHAKADLLAGYDFQTTTNGGTAAAASPNAPLVYTANVGSGTLYLDGTNGSSTWVKVATGNEVTGFAGSSLNAGGTTGLSTSTTGVTSLALLGGAGGTAANGKSIVFTLNMTGYQDLVLTYASQKTATGFNSQTFSYSTDGLTFTSLGATAINPATAFSVQTIDFSAISALDNAATVYIKMTFTGASSASGNNRIDNVQFNAVSAVPEPHEYGIAIAGMLVALVVVRRRRANSMA